MKPMPKRLHTGTVINQMQKSDGSIQELNK